MALVLLYDLAARARNLTAHYTELGVYPVSQAVHEYGSGVYFSLHAQLSGSPWAVGAVFVLHAATAVALLLGYRTRLASIASWYLLASVHARNDYVALMAGDDYLRLMLFWGIFLPLGARWSLDASRGRGSRARSVASLATFALLVQILLIYLGTGLLKSGPMWADGTAVYYALNLHQFETPLTGFLLEQRWALAPLSHFTLWAERLGALLLFVPFCVAAARLVAIALFTALHLGLALFLDLGPFPLMVLCGWTAVVPGAFWDTVLPRLRRRLGRREPDDAGGRSAAPRTPWPLQAIAAVSLVYVVAYQGVVLGFIGSGIENIPGSLRLYGKVLRLHQNWQMFAPDPSPTALWFGVDGRLADGSHHDPFRRTDAIWERHESIPASSRDFRWRLYTWTALVIDVESPDYLKHHRDFAEYLCWEWNTRHTGERRLTRMRTLVFLADTTPSGSELRPPSVLFEHVCDTSEDPQGRFSARKRTAFPPRTLRISSSEKPAPNIAWVRTATSAASKDTSVPPSQSDPNAT